MPNVHLQKWTLNPRIYVYLRRLLHEANLPAAQVGALQLDRLKRLLVDAAKQHEFYRERFHSAGFNPLAMRSVGELQTLPWKGTLPPDPNGAHLAIGEHTVSKWRLGILARQNSVTAWKGHPPLCSRSPIHQLRDAPIPTESAEC